MQVLWQAISKLKRPLCELSACDINERAGKRQRRLRTLHGWTSCNIAVKDVTP
jgi:hypothetical protein